MQHINEPFLLGKFLNALLTEYDVQKQMLEDKDGGFSPEIVMTTVRKRFESEAFKNLLPSRRNKKPLHGDQAFVANDAQGSGRQNGSPGKQRQGHGCSSNGRGAAVRGGAAVNQAAEAAVNPQEAGNAFASSAKAKSTSSGNAPSSSVRGAERKAIMSRYAKMWLKP